MIVTNYKKSLRGSGEAGKTTQQITHSSKVSHAQGKCYHGYYTYNCNMHKVTVHLSCHKLHVGMYVAASLSNCSTTTGKVLVKNVERKIMYIALLLKMIINLETVVLI